MNIQETVPKTLHELMEQLSNLKEENQHLRHERDMLLSDVRDDGTTDGMLFGAIMTKDLYPQFLEHVSTWLDDDDQDRLLSAYYASEMEGSIEFFSSAMEFFPPPFFEAVDHILVGIVSPDFTYGQSLPMLFTYHDDDILEHLTNDFTIEDITAFFDAFYRNFVGLS